MSGGLHLNTLLRSLLLGLVIASSGTTPQYIILGLLAGLLPVATANRFALKSGYGMVEARYHFPAYDCSDPSEVQAYSSVPASHCSIRATHIQKDRPPRFQLLQKEKKCISPHTLVSFLGGISATTAEYTDTWSWIPCTGLSVPQRVTFQQCMTWLRTRTYRPGYNYTMMHGKDFSQPILLDEPNYITYLVYGRTYIQAPALPTDLVSDIACQVEWFEYKSDQPFNHIVTFYDKLHLRTVNLVVEDGKVIDKDHQWFLPCPWDAGHCNAEGLTYLWNVTEPDYCPVAVVKEFLSHHLHANVSNPGDSPDSHQAEAIISAEVEEKIRIRPAGLLSQCGRVVTATNIEDMFLFPILETDDRGRVLTDNRGQAFTRKIHPSEVDVRKYIANRDEYLYYDITSQAEREFDTILHLR